MEFPLTGAAPPEAPGHSAHGPTEQADKAELAARPQEEPQEEHLPGRQMRREAEQAARDDRERVRTRPQAPQARPPHEEVERAAPPTASPLTRRPELMTMLDVAQRLGLPTELGAHAPAMITLKRWRAQGLLDAAKHAAPGKVHPLYDYTVIKEFCLQRLPMRTFAEVGAAAWSKSQPPEAAPLLAPLPSSGLGSAHPPAAPTRDRAHAPTDITTEVLERLERLEQLMISHMQQQTHAQAHLLSMMQDLVEQAMGRVMGHLDSQAEQIARVAASTADLEHTRKSLMARYDGETTALRARLEQWQTASRDNPGLELAAARLGQAAHRIETAIKDLQDSRGKAG